MFPWSSPAPAPPSLAGQVVLVTGGTAGIGQAAVSLLASYGPATVYFTGRSAAAGQRIQADLRQRFPSVAIHFIELDLASLEATKRTAARVLALAPRLDVLMLNAGVLWARERRSTDGYQIHVATNHLGHALLTQQLLPSLLAAAAPRVIVVASSAHKLPGLGVTDLDAYKTELGGWSTLAQYGVSKLANLQFARGLAERYPQITVAGVHPGMVYTDILLRHMPFSMPGWLTGLSLWLARSAEQGAATQVWCAHAEEVVSGAYYVDVGQRGWESALVERGRVDALWAWTDVELKRHGAQGWPAAV